YTVDRQIPQAVVLENNGVFGVPVHSLYRLMKRLAGKDQLSLRPGDDLLELRSLSPLDLARARDKYLLALRGDLGLHLRRFGVFRRDENRPLENRDDHVVHGSPDVESRSQRLHPAAAGSDQELPVRVPGDRKKRLALKQGHGPGPVIEAGL